MKSWIIAFTLFLVSCAHEKTESGSPVFSREIAPIIYERCTPCHRPGSGGPFDLVTYEDVKKKLQTVKLSINSRLMPPWPADTSYSRFKDEKVLTAHELQLLNHWIDAGAPVGNEKEIPQPPEFFNDSRFGKPDLVVSFTNPVFIEGNNKDHFRMLKVPIELPADTFIRAIEIVPGNKKLVHHVNVHLLQYAENARKNFLSGESSVDTEEFDKMQAYQKLDLKNDDGSYPMLTTSVSNYLPGVEASFYPHGIGGYKVKKNGALLIDNIHYGPSPVDTSDLTSFNIFFSPQPPERPVREFILGTSGISPVVPPLVLPADSVMRFTTSLKIQEDISLLTVNPHMHLLGVSFTAYALLPGGDTLPVIRIPQWDFRWQYFYTFRKIVKIPAGSVLVAEGIFDNTVNNPLNPNHPPKIVSEREGSMRTTDEMFQLICTYIPYRHGDEHISLETERK